MSHKPLRGVRVLDLSRLLRGPYCSLLLAHLGAEVVKIEDLEGGDYIRSMGPFIGDESAYFLALNGGKKSAALNLKSPAGLAVFMKLAARADVVIEGFRPGTAGRLGIGYNDVKAVNPRIVYCSISCYGYNLGDKVYLTAKKNGIEIVNQAIRLFGITFSIDENGNELVSSIQTTSQSA